MQPGRGGSDTLVPPTRWCEGEEALAGVGGVFQIAKGLVATVNNVSRICM